MTTVKQPGWLAGWLDDPVYYIIQFLHQHQQKLGERNVVLLQFRHRRVQLAFSIAGKKTAVRFDFAYSI
jgi:hypothetical protein